MISYYITLKICIIFTSKYAHKIARVEGSAQVTLNSLFVMGFSRYGFYRVFFFEMAESILQEKLEYFPKLEERDYYNFN